MAEEKGVWRTVSGRRIFIAEGQSLTDAMKKSGKFKGSEQKKINNSFKSRYGFENVGEVKSERTMWGIGSEGTVEPTTEAVQEYLDKHFANYGNSGKKEMIRRIANDMSGRGYKANVTEDGVHISNTDSSIVIGIGKNKDDEWKAKYSRSNGTTSRGGMKGVLDKYH